MDPIRRSKVIARSAIIGAGLAAMFWTAWYLVTGNIPEPLGFTRLWDIPASAIYGALLAGILTSDAMNECYRFSPDEKERRYYRTPKEERWVVVQTFCVGVGSSFICALPLILHGPSNGFFDGIVLWAGLMVVGFLAYIVLWAGTLIQYPTDYFAGFWLGALMGINIGMGAAASITILGLAALCLVLYAFFTSKPWRKTMTCFRTWATAQR